MLTIKYHEIISIIFLITGLLVISLVIANSNNEIIHAKQCLAQDGGSTSPGNWINACDNIYPGTALTFDDSSYETHLVGKQGANKYWAGILINSSNDSISDCKSIQNVQFCYKWWSETSDIDNCDISVDSDGGASYSVISTACPGLNETSNITCVNITSTEDWTCDAFFKSGALAKSEIQHSNGGINGYSNITWDMFFFNITYSNETLPPSVVLVTPLNNSVHTAGPVSFKCNVTSESLDNITFFLWNSTSLFNTSTKIVNGSFNESTWLIQNLSEEAYNWNCLGHDSYGKSGFAKTNYSLIINSSVSQDDILDITPPNNTLFNISDKIIISARIVMDKPPIHAYVNITFPDSSSQKVILTNISDIYSATFSIPDIFGRYNLTIFANDSIGGKQSRHMYFIVQDPHFPEIESAKTTRTFLFAGQSNILSMKALDNLGVDACWANITLPDYSEIMVSNLCSPPPKQFSNTTQEGTYNITYYAEDSYGNKNSTFGSFEVKPKISFKYSVDVTNSSNTVKVTFYVRGRSEIVSSNNSANKTIDLPKTILDIDVSSFQNRFMARLGSVNLTTNNNKNIKLDKHFDKEDSLVVYGVENTYNFSNATIILFYDDLDYSDDEDLHVLKCDEYNFFGRSCDGTWKDITQTGSKNSTKKYFEFTITSFSGFSVEEHVIPLDKKSEQPKSESSGSNDNPTWRCNDWSACKDSSQDKICTQYDSKNMSLASYTIKRNCSIKEDQEINTSEDKKKRLYEITLIVDEKLNEESGVLNAIVLFENFGSAPLTFNINFTVLDEKGQSYYNETSEVLVENMVWRNYSSNYMLPKGKYTVIIEASINSTTKEKIIKTAEIGKQGLFSSSFRILRNYKLLNWANMIGALILISITIAYLYYIRRGNSKLVKKDNIKK